MIDRDARRSIIRWRNLFLGKRGTALFLGLQVVACSGTDGPEAGDQAMVPDGGPFGTGGMVTNPVAGSGASDGVSTGGFSSGGTTATTGGASSGGGSSGGTSSGGFGSGGLATGGLQDTGGTSSGGVGSGGVSTGGTGTGGATTGGTSSGGTSSGGTSSGGMGSGGSGGDVCTAPEWDPTMLWSDYTPGEVRARDGAEWECTNVAWCWADPTGPQGVHGWTFVRTCDGSGTGGSGSGGSGSGGSGTGGSGGGGCDGVADIMSESQFNGFFPNRNGAYTYQGLLNAISGSGDLSGFPQFARQGSCDTRKRELAAFLGNVARETGQLVCIEQIDKSFPYCAARPYGCPAGTFEYFGRGPIQLSWNYNYYTASMALFGDDRLLQNPDLVSTNSAIAWATALWFWMTSEGAGVDTAHNVMVDGLGFGETIRTINGIQECNGGSAPFAQEAVSQRVCFYEKYVAAFGATVGPGNLNCGTTINRSAFCGGI